MTYVAANYTAVYIKHFANMRKPMARILTIIALSVCNARLGSRKLQL